MDKSLVSVVRSGESTRKQIEEAVRAAVQMAGGLPETVKPGALVLLKPNVVAQPPSLRCGATTNPDVVRAMADLVSELGAHPVIAESSAFGVNTELAYRDAGFWELREAGYEVIDLKRTPTVIVKVQGGQVIDEVKTFELVTKADAIISMPVMKTHDQTEITLSLKNCKGLIADSQKRQLHRDGVYQGVLDVVSALRPAFTLIDGTWAQEGLGPLYGRPVQMNLVLASRDLVAADAVAGAIMDFSLDEVLLTRYAAERGLGIADLAHIEVVGEPIARVRRRFLRSVEDHQFDVPGLRIIHAEGTCTGCRNGVVSVLYDLSNSGQLHLAEGLTMLTSKAEVPADCDPAKLITVGNCVPKERRGQRFAFGCPPNNVTIVEQIVGHPVPRTYETEGVPEQ